LLCNINNHGPIKQPATFPDPKPHELFADRRILFPSFFLILSSRVRLDLWRCLFLSNSETVNLCPVLIPSVLHTRLPCKQPNNIGGVKIVWNLSLSFFIVFDLLSARLWYTFLQSFIMLSVSMFFPFRKTKSQPYKTANKITGF
jgi:hypothetical protein